MQYTPRAALHLAWGLILFFGSVPAAKANQIFPFFYSIPSDSSHSMAVSAYGMLTTAGLSGGAYTVTGISGSWNGYTITGLLPPGSYGNNDNLLFPSGPHLDDSGISFQVNAPGDDGNGAVNVYYDSTSSGYTEYSNDVGYTQSFNVAFPRSYFNFSYAFPGRGSTPMAVSASGMLTTIQTGSGIYLVTDISGTWNGLSILGLAPVNTYGSNDNLLFLASPHLTDNGITFTVPGSADDGKGNVNVFYDFEQLSYTEYSGNVGHGNFQISATAPEPASALPERLSSLRRLSHAATFGASRPDLTSSRRRDHEGTQCRDRHCRLGRGGGTHCRRLGQGWRESSDSRSRSQSAARTGVTAI